MEATYINDIVDDKSYILGEIYMITNKLDGKSYIGQTVTHRLNHKRYRPYGYERRFKSHISEALCNNKKHQCSCLANAIRKDGSDNFEVTLLKRCHTNELDELEKQLIDQYDTIHPSGYNLAIGGNFKYRVAKDDFDVCETKVTPLPRQKPHAKDTIEKITTAVKKFRLENPEHMEEKYQQLKFKRDNKKMQALSEVSLNLPLEQYIHRHSSNNKQYAMVIVDKKRISFFSKYENYEQSKERALTFLKHVQTMNTNSTATLPN